MSIAKTMVVALATLICTDAAADHNWEVHFSPKGGCAAMVAKFVESGKKIRVSAYAFTSKPITEALVRVKKAGSDVEVVLDKSYATGASAKLLIAAGIRVWSDSRHPIMHDKFIIVDDAAVETGSFNYTTTAENSNAENCLIIHDAVLAKAYADNWELHRSHSH